MTEPIRDIAHLGHIELLTPKPEESLGFFRDVLGMEETARAGQSVFLRGWGDYELHTLKLTEAATGRRGPHGVAGRQPGSTRTAGGGARGERAMGAAGSRATSGTARRTSSPTRTGI